MSGNDTVISRATVMIYLSIYCVTYPVSGSYTLPAPSRTFPAFHCESALPQIDLTRVVQDVSQQLASTIIAWTVTKAIDEQRSGSLRCSSESCQLTV